GAELVGDGNALRRSGGDDREWVAVLVHRARADVLKVDRVGDRVFDRHAVLWAKAGRGKLVVGIVRERITDFAIAAAIADAHVGIARAITAKAIGADRRAAGAEAAELFLESRHLPGGALVDCSKRALEV